MEVRFQLHLNAYGTTKRIAAGGCGIYSHLIICIYGFYGHWLDIRRHHHMRCAFHLYNQHINLGLRPVPSRSRTRLALVTLSLPHLLLIRRVTLLNLSWIFRFMELKLLIMLSINNITH